jgi:hypothetical protein
MQKYKIKSLEPSKPQDFLRIHRSENDQTLSNNLWESG